MWGLGGDNRQEEWDMGTHIKTPNSENVLRFRTHRRFPYCIDGKGQHLTTIFEIYIPPLSHSRNTHPYKPLSRSLNYVSRVTSNLSSRVVWGSVVGCGGEGAGGVSGEVSLHFYALYSIKGSTNSPITPLYTAPRL